MKRSKEQEERDRALARCCDWIRRESDYGDGQSRTDGPFPGLAHDANVVRDCIAIPKDELAQLREDAERGRKAPNIWLEEKYEDIWLHINCASGRKASLNMGHRPIQDFFQSVLAECAHEFARKMEESR